MSDHSVLNTKDLDSEVKQLEDAGIGKASSRSDFRRALYDASDDALIATLGSISLRGATQLHRGYMQAVRAELDTRISRRNIEAMERLEGSANRLALVGVGVGVIGVIATFAQGCGAG